MASPAAMEPRKTRWLKGLLRTGAGGSTPEQELVKLSASYAAACKKHLGNLSLEQAPTDESSAFLDPLSLNTNNPYAVFFKTCMPILKLVRLDLERTYADTKLFATPSTRALMERVLLIYVLESNSEVRQLLVLNWLTLSLRRCFPDGLSAGHE